MFEDAAFDTFFVRTIDALRPYLNDLVALAAARTPCTGTFRAPRPYRSATWGRKISTGPLRRGSLVMIERQSPN